VYQAKLSILSKRTHHHKVRELCNLQKGSVSDPFKIDLPFSTLRPYTFHTMFPNQRKFGAEIANVFLNPTIFSVLAMALTQSGKTGSMLAVIEAMKASKVRVDHVFIITGLSSVDWMVQTRARFPPKYHDCIFHRNQLPRFVKKVKSLKHVLIIIDENQVAFKPDQSIHHAFQQAEIMRLHDLMRKQVRIVHFTATPTNTLDFLSHDFSDIVLMKPEPSYTSAFDLLDQNRILEYKDLCGLLDHDYSSVSWQDPDTWLPTDPQVFQHLDEIRRFLHEPKYHIIRTSYSFRHDVTISNFIKAFPDATMISDIDDLDTLLASPPNKHTFLFIKEKLRCAKTLHKTHLGVLYERITKHPKMDTILQGLVGRLTGYQPSSAVVFSNPQLVQDYRTQWFQLFVKFKRIPTIFIGTSF